VTEQRTPNTEYRLPITEYRSPFALGGACAAAALLLYATRLYGPGLSPDSVAYTATARHIAAGLGVLSYDNTPLVDQPPLYPALLALVRVLGGADPLASARWVNALLAALTVLAVAALLAPRVRSQALFGLGVALVVVARPLFAVASYSLSEPLFILLCTLFLLLADRYAARRSLGALLLLAGAAALATLTRYVGVTLIGTGGLLLLLERGRTWRGRVARAALFGLVAAAPVAGWLARNVTAAGSLMGPRAPSRTTLAEALRHTLATFGGWAVAPDDLNDVQDVLPDLRPLLALPAAGLPAAPTTGAPARAWHPLLPVGLFAALYLALLLYTSTSVLYDRIGDRLLAPLFVPLLVLLLGALDGWARAGGRVRRAAVIAGAAALLLLSGTATVVRAVKAAEGGAGGYQRRSWQESSMVDHLRAHPPPAGTPLYTNAPDALYLFFGLQGTLPPSRNVYDPAQTPVLLAGLRGVWPPEGDALLLWFDRQERVYLFSPDELTAAARVQEVARFEDGAIYTVSRE
jgi:hypothetical protein